MMLAHLKALDLLMKFFIFALCLIPALAYPVNATDSLTTLEKCTLNPPLPTLQEARQHVKKLPKDKSIFYLGQCQMAASFYGSKHGMVMLANADDGSGWLQFEGGPFHEYVSRQCDDEPTWTEDEEWQAINIISQAFAAESSGVATVVLPYIVHDSKNHWDGEFETLKVNPNIHKVVAFDMKDCTADPQGQPRELWPRNEAKTAHAG
ncbi:uncharacterized protein ACHE_80064A [Aspergillus chevalieri]|uniref:Secreted protein n=1 Tax=Aspergillus chevalieri TaxID=182096 RepID=A0A7R7ZSZ2_ASPCH|nr:uncharacterized protein ACHE_80064A [Aspergillus chevalieri]BCR92164.1 hypothetical protein ACHE_80064A [Aspergillus chevalieri]